MDKNQLQSIKNNFLSELEKAYEGKNSSLPFIVHEMPSFSTVEESQEFQVLVIGGTYATSARVKKENRKCIVLTCDKTTLPMLLNKEDFLLFIEQNLFPDVSVLALNFAFPIKPVFENGRLDGILLRGTKGHTFRGLTGQKVGHEIEQLILQKRNKKITVSVANDTVCLLLSGLEKSSSDKLGAGIVGSGMNFAFYLSQNKLVNLESADFNKFEVSSEAYEIDKESSNPGKSLYEKEVAGVYLYKHFNILLRENHTDHPPLSSTEELDTLARNNSDTAHVFAQSLFERSAKLIACQMASIMEFRKTDMLFVMEGSLFWKGYEYKKTVEKTLESLTNYKAEFVEVKDSGVVGAAHLVT